AGDMHFSQTRYVLIPGAHSDFLLDRATFVHSLAVVEAGVRHSDHADVGRISAAFAHVDALDRQLWADVRVGETAKAKALVAGAGNDASDTLVGALTTYQVRLGKQEAQATATFNS